MPIEETVKDAASSGDLLRLHVADENIRDAIATEVAQRVALALAQAAAEVHAYEAQKPRDEIDADKQFFSVGHCCQLLQVGPAGLRRLMKKSGVRFACAFNDVPQLDYDGLEAVADCWRELNRLAGENV